MRNILNWSPLAEYLHSPHDEAPRKISGSATTWADQLYAYCQYHAHVMHFQFKMKAGLVK